MESRLLVLSWPIPGYCSHLGISVALPLGSVTLPLQLKKKINICSAKGTINRVMRQPTEWEKIFVNYTVDEGLMDTRPKWTVPKGGFVASSSCARGHGSQVVLPQEQPESVSFLLCAVVRYRTEELQCPTMWQS